MKNTKLFFLVFTFVTFSCIGDRTPEEMSRAISESPVLMRLDKLCTELPKPNDFRFIRKQFGGNTSLASLVFDYNSDLKPAEIKQFYSEWARKNQWKISDEDKYVKEEQTIVIEFGSSPMNTTISCKEQR